MSSKNQEKNDTPVNRPVDKIFAENLGYTFGGCVRDLSGSLFNKEVAKAAGVSLCPIPLLGGEEKRRFKAFWAANLQAVAMRTAVENLPSYADEKLLKKTLFQMQTFVDQALGRPLFSKLSPEDLDRYSTIRSRMTQAALTPGADKESMARTFLALVHGTAPDSVPDSRVSTSACPWASSSACSTSRSTLRTPGFAPSDAIPRKVNAQAPDGRLDRAVFFAPAKNGTQASPCRLRPSFFSGTSPTCRPFQPSRPSRTFPSFRPSSARRASGTRVRRDPRARPRPSCGAPSSAL